jgi:hypothetical protein
MPTSPREIFCKADRGDVGIAPYKGVLVYAYIRN